MTKMTYYDDYLEHHGVKGMKWGVRKYKDIRREAKGYQRAKDAAASQKYKAERNFDRARLESMTKRDRLSARKQVHDIVGSKRTAKKVAKATDKYSKAREAEAKAYERKRIDSHTYNQAQYRYQKAVKQAADLPIYIKRRNRTANLKRNMKSVGLGTASAVLADQLGTTPVSTGLFKVRKTRNDRFAESVDTQQQRKQLKKGGY